MIGPISISTIFKTGILCRWAFCISLAEPSVPPSARIPIDSNVEMTWKVFGGQYYGIYHALLKQRCKQDGLSINALTLSDQFKFHLQKES